jgi:hypothetical protein
LIEASSVKKYQKFEKDEAKKINRSPKTPKDNMSNKDQTKIKSVNLSLVMEDNEIISKPTIDSLN